MQGAGVTVLQSMAPRVFYRSWEEQFWGFLGRL